MKIRCEILQKGGIDKKALQAGINYYEFRFREADFGSYPRGLMYGLQLFDSWLYDEEKPFIHMEAIPTFEFLKSQIETGYFEQLIRELSFGESARGDRNHPTGEGKDCENGSGACRETAGV